MGEEVKMSEHMTMTNGGDGGGGEYDNGYEERVIEWEMGLPNCDDLTPLSQSLVPPELASAFSISPEPFRTLFDVNRASQTTLSGLRGQLNALSSNNFKAFNDDDPARDPVVVDAEEDQDGGSGSDIKKQRRIESEEADSFLRMENSVEDPSAKTLKRPRLVWTPQLHKRFVDVVAHIGIKNAVPKTIMNLMNVEGLTRENVASHLQKYRLYLKRMQGLSNEGPSSSDQLFASTPVPQSLHEAGGNNGGAGGGGGATAAAGHANGHMGMPIPMFYQPPSGTMMPMPVYEHMGMQMPNNPHHLHHYHPQFNHHHHHQNHGVDGNHTYNMMQQRDWSSNNYGSVVSYPPHPHHVGPNNM